MSQVLITGATGLVGGHLLRMLINEPKVNAIAAPTRRPLGDMPGVFNPHDPQLTDALAQVTDPIDIVPASQSATPSQGLQPDESRQIANRGQTP
jgi:uncharacterized protein YbjT (DUF2867 family)